MNQEGRRSFRHGDGMLQRHGAEICQLVAIGTFVLVTITKGMSAATIGLYRDNGLGVLRDRLGSKAERSRKDLKRCLRKWV